MPAPDVSFTICFSGERQPTTTSRPLTRRGCAEVLFDVKMTLVNVAIKLPFGCNPRGACRTLAGTGMILYVMVVVTCRLENLLVAWPSTFDP